MCLPLFFRHIPHSYVPITSLSNPPNNLCSIYHTLHPATIPRDHRGSLLQYSLQPLCQQASGSELLLCVSTAGLLEQGQAGQHLSCWQFSVDFVVPRTHIDTVSHLLLLSDHCQGTHNSSHHPVHTTGSHTHTLTHCSYCPKFMLDNVLSHRKW